MRPTIQWPLVLLVFAIAACTMGNPLAPGESPASDPTPQPTVELQPTATAELEATPTAEPEPTPPPSVGPTVDVDSPAQQQTVADIRNVGTAMFSWLTDQVGSVPSDRGPRIALAGTGRESWAPRGSLSYAHWRPEIFAQGAGEVVDLTLYPAISREDLQAMLVPQYMQDIPEEDGWGHPFEYYYDKDNPLAMQVMAIRSPGRDGLYSGTSYVVASFPPADYDEDIVWADGFFVRFPY